jgi:hypothetical protein
MKAHAVSSHPLEVENTGVGVSPAVGLEVEITGVGESSQMGQSQGAQPEEA